MKRAIWWVVSAVIAIGITYFSSRIGAPFHVSHAVDRVSRLCAYLALGYSLSRASGGWGAAWVLAAWLGAVNEVQQAFVLRGEAGFQGWFFDALGGLLGALLGVLSRGEVSTLADEMSNPFDIDFEFDQD